MLAPPAGKRPDRRRQASLLLAGKHLVNGTLRHAGMRVLAGMAQTFPCDPAIEAVRCPGYGPGPESRLRSVPICRSMRPFSRPDRGVQNSGLTR